MKKTLYSATLAICIGIAAPASADDFSFVGTLADGNDVKLFDFTVPVSSSVTLRTYSYAGGTNAASNVIAQGGFDPILALFDSTGALVSQNDDGGCGLVAADSMTGACWDTFFQSVLSPGNYTVSVMAYSNFAVGPNLSNGFFNTGSFGNRTNAWAFDILNVGEAAEVGAVPEPSTWAMMLLGFGFVGGAMRSAKRRQKVTVSYA